jgi:hypothetical protein
VLDGLTTLAFRVVAAALAYKTTRIAGAFCGGVSTQVGLRDRFTVAPFYRDALDRTSRAEQMSPEFTFLGSQLRQLE